MPIKGIGQLAKEGYLDRIGRAATLHGSTPVTLKEKGKVTEDDVKEYALQHRYIYRQGILIDPVWIRNRLDDILLAVKDSGGAAQVHFYFPVEPFHIEGLCKKHNFVCSIDGNTANIGVAKNIEKEQRREEKQQRRRRRRRQSAA